MLALGAGHRVDVRTAEDIERSWVRELESCEARHEADASALISQVEQLQALLSDQIKACSLERRARVEANESLTIARARLQSLESGRAEAEQTLKGRLDRTEGQLAEACIVISEEQARQVAKRRDVQAEFAEATEEESRQLSERRDTQAELYELRHDLSEAQLAVMQQKVEASELREQLADAGALRAELRDLQHQLLEGSAREQHLKGDLFHLNSSCSAFVEEVDTSRAELHDATRHNAFHAAELQGLRQEASECAAALRAALEALRHADDRHCRELYESRAVVEQEVTEDLAKVLRRRLGASLGQAPELGQLHCRSGISGRLVASEHNGLMRLLQEDGVPRPSATLIGMGVGDFVAALLEERSAHLSIAGVLDEAHVSALVGSLRKLASRSSHLATASRLHLSVGAPGAGGAAVTAAIAPEGGVRRELARAVPVQRPGPIRSLKRVSSGADAGAAGVGLNGRHAADAGLRKDISIVDLTVSEALHLCDEVEALLPGMRRPGASEVSPRRLASSLSATV